MKILHIIDELSMGGAENLLIGLAGEQVKLGHEVTVTPLVCPRHTVVRDKMEEKGVCVMPLKDKGSVYNPFLSIKIATKIRKYDIVHVHLFPALYWSGLGKVLSLCKVPLVYTEHSTKNKRRGNRLLHFTDKIIYQYGYKRVIACSEKAEESYRFSYPTINHICHINNGVDTKVFREAIPYTKKDLLGLDENVFVITMVARFMSMKRQDTIVEAITKLPEEIHAVFVGGEQNDDGLLRVKRIAEDKGVLDRIHFLYIRSDVPRILKTSNVIVMASDYEGLSLSSVEGMAAGKPFVATNVDGLKEIVGGAGFLFDNKDSDGLAGIVKQLYENKELYEKTCANCQKRASEFDVRKMAEEYMALYEQIMSE